MVTSRPWVRPFLGTLAGLGLGAITVWFVWVSVTMVEVLHSLDSATTTIGAQTTKIRDTQKSSRSILDFINDCTKPRGACYQASEARDAEQVGKFNAAVIAAAWCATQHPESRHELTLCVGDILDGKDKP